MGYLGLPARNPLAQFAIALTDWLVAPAATARTFHGPSRRSHLAGRRAGCDDLRRAAVPSDRHWHGKLAADWLLLVALIELLRWALYLVLWLTLLQVVLSWVNPHAPIAPAVSMLARPFLAPFQRALPQVGGIDLSPLVVILIVNVMLIVLARSGL